MADSPESRGPEFETQPDRVDVSPDFETLPDRVDVSPDFETLPDRVDVSPDFETLPDPVVLPQPDVDIPDGSLPSLEELEMALHRAQLVLEDLSTLFEPALRAMEDGAWVSRRADEFSGGLTSHAGLADSTGQRCVEAIQEAIDSRGGGNPVDPIGVMPL